MNAEKYIKNNKEKALQAYNQIKDYCFLQSGCDGCLFEMAEPYEGMRLLVDEGAPKHWPELEI